MTDYQPAASRSAAMMADEAALAWKPHQAVAHVGLRTTPHYAT
jgi:hypothetical protein